MSDPGRREQIMAELLRKAGSRSNHVKDLERAQVMVKNATKSIEVLDLESAALYLELRDLL